MESRNARSTHGHTGMNTWRRASAVGLTALMVVACGADASTQDQAGDAVNAFIEDDDVLADGGFDEECIISTARGLPDEIADDIVADGGRIDLDVDDRDRDDVYDFYNCADERDLARAIADETDTDSDCLEEQFDSDDIGDILNAFDGDDADRFGDFDGFDEVACFSGTTTDAPVNTTPVEPAETTPETTTAPATTVAPDTTVPPMTLPPMTAPPVTAAPATPAPTNPPVAAEPMPSGSDAQLFAQDTEAFLETSPDVAAAVGGAITDPFCIEPSHTTVGANYLCFAEAAGVGSTEFRVVIDTASSFLVEDFLPTASGDKVFLTALSITAFRGDRVDQFCVRDLIDVLSEEDATLIRDGIDDETFTVDEFLDAFDDALSACAV